MDGKRRILCPSCFGQGVRYYSADPTGRHRFSISYSCVLENEWIEEDPLVTMGLGDHKRQFLFRRVCRSCGGTGWTYTRHVWKTKALQEGGAFNRLATSYGFLTYYHDSPHIRQTLLESLDRLRDDLHLGACLAQEKKYLEKQVNKMHRRAQRAEGKIEKLEAKCQSKQQTIESLRKHIHDQHWNRYNSKLRSRVPKTVRINRPSKKD